MAVTYESIVADVDVKRQALATAKASLASAQQSVAAWQAAVQADVANQASVATMQNTAQELAAAKARVEEWKVKVAEAQSDLDAAVRLRDQLQAAISKNIANGMTPEEAARKAASDVDRAATVNNVIKIVAIVVGIGVVVYAVSLFLKWRKSRK